MSGALGGNLFESFLNYLYQSGDIFVPAEYHDRCNKIEVMLDNDISGMINSLLDYAVNSSSEANYRVECSEPTLQKLLNTWLDRINLDIKGIPTGLQALSTEYFRERWEGSSFCVLRIADWEEIAADGVTIEVPTTMWFVNGGSIYVSRPKEKNYQLGTDKYFLDSGFKYEIPHNKEENIIVQKPYDRWFDEYSTPYLIRKGVYKNWLAMKTLQDKSDEVIAKVLPYLFLIQKGTEQLYLQGEVNYTDDDLKQLVDNFKVELEKYKGQRGRVPTQAVPFDQKYEHLIPDLKNILTEELYRQGVRSMLAGLGFIDMLEITPSRQEDRLNPKPFIAEVNNGVNGFKSILLETIYLIISRNKSSHRKLFSASGKIIVVNSPLKINTEKILDAIRSGFDRGGLSIESYVETLGFDYTIEKEKRQKELDNGDEELMYPHLIQNQEATPDRMGVPAKPKTVNNPKLEDQNKKKNSPETKTKTSELEEKYITKCKKCGHEFEYLSVKEAGMGYVKCPKCEEAVTQEDLIMAPYQNLDKLPSYIKKMEVECQNVFMTTFNSVLEDSDDESKAMAIGISAAKRCMKKKGYTYNKETKNWKK